MTSRTTLNIVCAAFIVFWIVVILAVISAGHVDAHEGDHPLSCVQVDIPMDADCYEPGTYEAENGDRNPHHPVCLIEVDGVGSTVAEYQIVRCLPDTGATSSLLAIIGGSVLAAGAAMLILGGIAKGVGEADDA